MRSSFVAIALAFAVVAASLGSGCVTIGTSVATPTALERQLLGVYEELDEDLRHAASVRGDGAGTPSFAGMRAKAVEGRALQRFNEDDVAELKAAGCLAETLQGRIVDRPCEVAGETGESLQRRLTRVVTDENRARDAIVSWAAHVQAREAGQPAPTADGVRNLWWTYARLLKEAAAPGHVLEVEPGVFRAVQP